MIEIFLFGSFEVVVGGKKLEDRLWQGRQVRALLKILVTNRDIVITSEQLIEDLWPEDDPETARHRLYVRMSQLRKSLHSGTDFNPIQKVQGGYAFVQTNLASDIEQGRRSVWVDVDAFEEAADRGRLFLEQ